MPKKFKYLYKTTNLVNGKIYIGVHCTDYLDDGYIGSGLIIKRAIQKYGKENFKKEILEWFDNANSLYQRERELVTEEFVNRDDNYNLGLGGKNQIYYGEDNPFYGKSHNKETIERMKVKLSEILSDMIYINKYNVCKRINKEDADWYYQRGWFKGTLNKNTKWVHRNSSQRMIKESELEEYISNGWVIGRLDKTNKDMIHINNGHNSRMVNADSLDQFLEQGWEIGSLYKPNKNKKCVNKDGKNKFIPIEELEKYLKDGWLLGMIKKDFENPFKNKKHTDEAKETIRQKASENSKGRIWVNKEGRTKMIYPNQLCEFLENGWKKGRK